jgi:hypothetical protein
MVKINSRTKTPHRQLNAFVDVVAMAWMCSQPTNQRTIAPIIALNDERIDYNFHFHPEIKIITEQVHNNRCHKIQKLVT